MLPYPFPGPFDYRLPAELTVQPGDVVLAPLNRREEIGVVWDPGTRPTGSGPLAGSSGAGEVPDGSGNGADDHGVPERKLKALIAVLDTPPMRPDVRRLVDWIASYTLSPPGVVMAMALRVVSPTPDGRNPAGAWPRRCPRWRPRRCSGRGPSRCPSRGCPKRG